MHYRYGDSVNDRGGYIVLPTLMYSEFMTEVGSGRIPMAGAIGIFLLLINVVVLFWDVTI